MRFLVDLGLQMVKRPSGYLVERPHKEPSSVGASSPSPSRSSVRPIIPCQLIHHQLIRQGHVNVLGQTRRRVEKAINAPPRRLLLRRPRRICRPCRGVDAAASTGASSSGVLLLRDLGCFAAMIIFNKSDNIFNNLDLNSTKSYMYF